MGPPWSGGQVSGGVVSEAAAMAVKPWWQQEEGGGVGQLVEAAEVGYMGALM